MGETVQEEDLEDIESLDDLDNDDEDNGDEGKPQALQQPNKEQGEDEEEDSDDGYEWEEIRNLDADAIIEWDKKGRTLKGFYQGREERGKGAAHFFDHMEADATLLVWETTVLEDKLEGLQEGTPIKITYLGEKTSNSGQDYKDFKVLRGTKTE